MKYINGLGDKMKELKDLLPSLPSSSVKFAADLIKQWDKYGSLSNAQEPYIQQLIDRAKNPEKALRQTEDVGDFSLVIQMFNEAKAHLKFPKLHFNLGEFEFVMSVTGKMSKEPGQINIASPGAFGEAVWYGRVSPEGKWAKSKAVTEEIFNHLAGLLIDLGLDPSGTAEKYGKQSGSCCFCNKKLTDPKSLKAGFGPVCAEHFGLTAQWKGLACP